MPETRLDGVHHFTGVTADVTANIDFWCRILGLRFVKKTLNFETTFRYHPYYGDEQGNPGSVVTFLEFKELERRAAGRRQHPADRAPGRLIRRGRILAEAARRAAGLLGAVAARPDAAHESDLPRLGGPRGRADGHRLDRCAPARRRRRHPRGVPDPRDRGRALLRRARGRRCRSASISGSPPTANGWCWRATTAPRAGTSARRPGGRFNRSRRGSGTTWRSMPAISCRSGASTRPAVRSHSPRSSTTTSSTAATRNRRAGSSSCARTVPGSRSTRRSRSSARAQCRCRPGPSRCATSSSVT